MPKKEKIQDMFDSIAPEYDYLNHLLSMDIDKRQYWKSLTRTSLRGYLTWRAEQAISQLQLPERRCSRDHMIPTSIQR